MDNKSYETFADKLSLSMTSLSGNANATEATFALVAEPSPLWFLFPFCTRFKVTSPILSTFVVIATLAALRFNGKSAEIDIAWSMTVTSFCTETSQSSATFEACAAKSAGEKLCEKFLSSVADGRHPGFKFNLTDPEPLQMD